jgi:hypothetical protein
LSKKKQQKNFIPCAARPTRPLRNLKPAPLPIAQHAKSRSPRNQKSFCFFFFRKRRIFLFSIEEHHKSRRCVGRTR